MDLMPCPFCAEYPDLKRIDRLFNCPDDIIYQSSWIVQCKCGVKSPEFKTILKEGRTINLVSDGQKDAITFWNTRSPFIPKYANMKKRWDLDE